jgi:hypothetical protein
MANDGGDAAAGRLRWAATTILLAGIAAGAVDFIFASGLAIAGGGSAVRVWIGVAAALFGIKTIIAVGQKMAIVGALLHFMIAVGGAAVFYLASRAIPWLVRRPLLAALPYGLGFFLVMNYVIVPLSVMGRSPSAGLKGIAIGILSHIILIGLPTSFVTAWRFRQAAQR